MLSGIPEIDLGINAKLKNIEATENAKLEMLQRRGRKTGEISCMVPINMAVNYVQHKRCKLLFENYFYIYCLHKLQDLSFLYHYVKNLCLLTDS